MDPPPPFFPRYVPLSPPPPPFYHHLPPPPPLPYHHLPPPSPLPYNPHDYPRHHPYSPPRVRLPLDHRSDFESRFRVRDNYLSEFSPRVDLRRNIDYYNNTPFDNDTRIDGFFDYRRDMGNHDNAPVENGNGFDNNTGYRRDMRNHDNAPVENDMRGDGLDNNTGYCRDVGNYDNATGFRDSFVGNDVRVNGFGNRDVGFDGIRNDIYYGSNSNLNDFDGRARNEVFNSSPNNNNNKQVQKKSALLRIQFNTSSKGRNNNRNEDRGFRSDTRKDELDATKVLDTKRVRSRGSERVGEERDGRSVELDVSFKSNSLVAKAIDVESEKKRKIANLASLPSTKKPSLKLKKKVVKPKSCVTIPEREERLEPVRKPGSMKSIVVSPKLDEADTESDDKKLSVSVGVDKFDSQLSDTVDEFRPAIVSREEDIHVDVGGSPMHDFNGKSNSSPHLSSSPIGKKTGSDESTVSGNKSDDLHTFKSYEKTSVEVVSNADNFVTCPENNNVLEGHVDLSGKLSDEHIDLVSDKNQLDIAVSDKNQLDIAVSDKNQLDIAVSDKNQLDIAVSDINAVDLVTETDKAVVVLESSGGNSLVDISGRCTSTDRKDREIIRNLVIPSAVDMFLKEFSECTFADKTTLSNPPKDHISGKQHIVVSGSEKDSICRSSSISEDSSSSYYSSEKSSSSNESSPKHGKKGNVFASVSSSPMLSEENEEDSVSSDTSTSSSEESSTHSEDRDVGAKFDIFPSVRTSPCSESGILVSENIGAGADKVLAEENITENSLHVENEKRSNAKEFDARQEKGMPYAESFQHKNTLEIDMGAYQILPVSDMECDEDLLGKDNLPSFPTDLSLRTDDTSDKRLEIESRYDEVSNSGSQETPQVSTESHMFKTETGLRQTSEEMDWEVISNPDVKPSVGPSLSFPVPAFQNTSTNENSSHAIKTVNSFKPKSVGSMRVAINTNKNLLPPAVPKSFRLNSSVTKTPPTSQNSKARKWQRSSSPSIPLVPVKNAYTSSVYRRAQSPTLAGNVPKVAYVRKGNSLVRTPPISATPTNTHALGSSLSWLNSSSIDDTKKITGNDFSFMQSPSRTDLNATIERPNTPPLQCSTKVSNYINLSSGSATSASLVDPLQNVCSETGLDPSNLAKPSNGISEFSSSHENLAGQNDSCESHDTIEGKLVPASTGKLVYVKKKANQLVAASSSGLSAQNTEALPSAGYFKRRENQLVRKSLDNGVKVGMLDENLNSPAISASRIIASSFRKRSAKGFGKKPSRFSLVWTLHNAESLNKETSLSQVWPHLFPWKRATHRRRFTYNQASVANNGSSSSIRKLLLARQRKTIYKRSPRGLSLRISKVLSVDGSSLKWSKSIEKNCRITNEEATLAVAAVERRKREKDVVIARTKNRNHTSRKLVHNIELRPGERIFRVGSIRYKMDPTRRTLQRISDEESSCSIAVQSGKDMKKSSVPRRLVIGNREYVRIGNGNQLIRDPKKRTRILANEKVRWSLHTARLSLAKKKTYCQFFTRFGKCNKGGGKCPYIHDPEKIAVCTKFLMGSCSDSECKLTHKVIPERMQDCSFFLQGLCSNESCPYRHVNVNPNASICEGFLKGYCADGNECRKKHSYVCPIFESTGTCPQRSECKLHHPKNQNKGKRKESCKGKNNFRGRYFGSKHISVIDTKVAMSRKPFTEDDDDMFFQEGKFADFIPLDVSDEEEDGEPFDSTLELKSSYNSHLVDVDIDDLIKPVGIMKKRKLTKDASPTV